MKILSLLTLLFFFIPLSAQIDVEGACLDGPVMLTETMMVDGKISYSGTGDAFGMSGLDFTIQWSSADGVWVFAVNAEALFFNADDTAEPPSSAGATWTNADPGLCPEAEPFVLLVDGALPVNWLSFTGALTDKNDVRLLWETSAEEGNQGFHVERSLNGENWSRIGYLDGAGDSESDNNYQFDDTNPLNGQNFYRLMQEDFDGDFSYSRVIVIDHIAAEGALSAFPNPVNGLFVLAGPTETGEVTILSSSGRVVKRITNYAAGNSISLAGLASDVYLVKFQNKETSRVTRVVFSR